RVRGRRALLAYRSEVQMIFQDPFASLNPVKRVQHHLERPLRIHGLAPKSQIDARVRELLETVGLVPPDEIAQKYPHQLSGEQGPTDDVLQNPQHLYTRLLLSAVPNPEGGAREPFAKAHRPSTDGELVEVRPGHFVRQPTT